MPSNGDARCPPPRGVAGHCLTCKCRAGQETADRYPGDIQSQCVRGRAEAKPFRSGWLSSPLPTQAVRWSPRRLASSALYAVPTKVIRDPFSLDKLLLRQRPILPGLVKGWGGYHNSTAAKAASARNSASRQTVGGLWHTATSLITPCSRQRVWSAGVPCVH